MKKRLNARRIEILTNTKMSPSDRIGIVLGCLNMIVIGRWSNLCINVAAISYADEAPEIFKRYLRTKDMSIRKEALGAAMETGILVKIGERAYAPSEHNIQLLIDLLEGKIEML